jgi:hypothetical protein
MHHDAPPTSTFEYQPRRPHPARRARGALAVLSCTATLAVVGVLWAGQPAATSTTSAAASHTAGGTIHTTSSGSTTQTSTAGTTATRTAAAAQPSASSHTSSGGS